MYSSAIAPSLRFCWHQLAVLRRLVNGPRGFVVRRHGRWPAAVYAGGSDAVGRSSEAVTPRAVAGVPGDAGDVAALASWAGGLSLGLFAHRSRRSQAGPTGDYLVVQLARENPRSGM